MVQRYEFFLYFQIFSLEIVGRGAFVMECELCVYGQEMIMRAEMHGSVLTHSVEM
jgi:hypothetical protein